MTHEVQYACMAHGIIMSNTGIYFSLPSVFFIYRYIYTINQAEKHRELSLVRAEEEDKIATALARRTLEKDRKEREIQQLREQSQELRE